MAEVVHRRTSDIRFWMICGAAMIALVFASNLLGAQSIQSVPLPDNPIQGWALFANRQCHRCHGLAGDRSGIGPNLGDGSFEGTFLELGADLWNHVPGMSVTFEVTGLEWPRLSDTETIELVVFLNFIDYLGRPGASEAGERVFHEKRCDECHSVGGGEAHLALDLAELENFASPLFIARQIWNHGPSMLESMRQLGLRPPRFEEGDLADLSAYIRQRSAPGPRERSLLAPGNPNRGAELFVSKGCALCHGSDGRGGSSGPNLADTDLHRSADGIASTMWNHALAMSASMQALGVGWPEFQDSELADLISFLYFIPFDDPIGDRERGAEVFRSHTCAECHGDSGSGGEAPALAGTDAVTAPNSLVAAMWNHAPTMKTAILSEGRRWPELSGQDLRDLLAFFADGATTQ